MLNTPELLSPPPSKKPFIVENIEPDDRLIKRLFPNMLGEHIARYRYAAECVRLIPPMDRKINILDIASARGYGSDILKKELPNGNVFGMEYKRDYVEKAHKKYPEPNFLQGDARAIPFADESMDLVTAFEIIEHLPRKDQQNFLKEIFRVLKKDGKAVVSIPEPYSGGIGSNAYHLHEPSQEEMQKYIERAGLKTVETLGQICVSPIQAKRMKALNKVVPVWPIFAWGPSRDITVRNVPEGELALTHIFVLKKATIST